MIKIDEWGIADACNEAYFKVQDNAYFGNGFSLGVQFALGYINKNYLNIFKEFAGIIKDMGKYKEANEFIIEIAKLLDMDADCVGYDDIKFSIDDFQEAINKLKE